jgi:hypothetical protein
MPSVSPVRLYFINNLHKLDAKASNSLHICILSNFVGEIQSIYQCNIVALFYIVVYGKHFIISFITRNSDNIL